MAHVQVLTKITAWIDSTLHSTSSVAPKSLPDSVVHAQLQQCGTKITAWLSGTQHNTSSVAPKSLPDSVVHHTTPAVWYQNHCPTQWYTAQYQQCHTYSHSKTASDLTINHVHSWYWMQSFTKDSNFWYAPCLEKQNNPVASVTETIYG